MEETKKYSVVGKVEIGTDEYRDLIESVAQETRRADENRSRMWEEQKVKDKATSDLKMLKAKMDEVANFFILKS